MLAQRASCGYTRNSLVVFTPQPGEAPSGIGQPGAVPLAAAIGNAICEASGRVAAGTARGKSALRTNAAAGGPAAMAMERASSRAVAEGNRGSLPLQAEA
jgi:hypothetical protein